MTQPLCTLGTGKALPWRGPALGMGTCPCVPRIQEWWHSGAVVATRLVSLVPGGLQHSLWPCSPFTPSPRSGSSRLFLTHFPSVHCTIKQNGAGGADAGEARGTRQQAAQPSGTAEWHRAGLRAGLGGAGSCSGSERGPGVVRIIFSCPLSCMGHVQGCGCPREPWRSPAVLPVSPHPAGKGRCGADPEGREGTGIGISTDSQPPPHPRCPSPARPTSIILLPCTGTGGQRLLPRHKEG